MRIALILLLSFLTQMNYGQIQIFGTVTVSCDGNVGSIDIDVTNGIPPYSFVWSDGWTGEDLQFITGGTYQVTVSDSEQNLASHSWFVEEFVMPVQVVGTIDEPDCNDRNGALNGSITLNPDGGVFPYSFVWTGPGVQGFDQNQSGLGTGTYRVTITDANGCIDEDEFILTEPNEISIEANIANYECSGFESIDGSITVFPSGGAGAYTYQWLGNGVSSLSQNQNELLSGSYAVTVIDAMGCSETEVFEITGALPMEVSSEIINVVCDENGIDQNGSINLEVSGGVPPYIFDWSGNNIELNSQNQNNLSTGNYTVTVRDSEGCRIENMEFSIINNPIVIPQICNVSSDIAGHNTIYWQSPVDLTGIGLYNIFREETTANQFELIGSINVAEDNFFVDPDAEASQQAYSYFMKSANSCAQQSQASEIHKTIHLEINQGLQNNIELNWNQYKGLDYDQITIYRGDSPINMEEYKVLPSNVFTFIDEDVLEGESYYQIVINIPLDCNTANGLSNVNSNTVRLLLNDVKDVDWLQNIYPNPFSETIDIQLESAAMLTIIDVQGKSIVTINLEEGNNTISTNDLSKGIFMFRLVSNGEITTWRGIKK